MVMTDAYLANGAEPWKIPDVDQIKPIEVTYAAENGVYRPYDRDPDTLARHWAIPGMPGLEHRLGGLEKEDGSGNVSYDPENHHHMTTLRRERVERINQSVQFPEVYGEDEGDVLIVSWGSTYGTVLTTVDQLREEGKKVSFFHLRWLNPLPGNLEDVMKKFKKVVVPEMNLGQLSMLIRSRYLVDTIGFNRVTGLPLSVSELKEAIDDIL